MTNKTHKSNTTYIVCILLSFLAFLFLFSKAQAASPIIAATNTFTDANNATSHTASLPAGVQSGDLLVVIFSIGQGSDVGILWPNGWKNFYIGNAGSDDSNQLQAAYRIADGTEGATITIHTDGLTRSAGISYRITGYDASLPVESAWAGPANYHSMVSINVFEAGLAVAERALEAASEDPGVFAWRSTINQDWVAANVAVHPSGASTPTVEGRMFSNVNEGTVTSHVVSLPSNISSGNLLIAYFLRWGNNNDISWPAGWTSFVNVNSSQNRLSVAYRQADGTEGATTTVTTTGLTRSAHVVYRITGHKDPATQAPEGATATGIGGFEANPPSLSPTGGSKKYLWLAAGGELTRSNPHKGPTGTTGNPDPPSFSPTGGAKDYMWLPVALIAQNTAATAAPTNYTNLLNANLFSNGLASARRELNAASEDPGTFDFGAPAVRWVAATLAVHPETATTTTLGDGTDGANSTIGPGASATEIDRFSLVTSSGTDTVTGMTVTFGPAGAFNNIATVDVQTIAGASKCSLTPTSNTVLLTSCAISVTTSSTEYKVMITPKTHANMPAVPGASYATVATVTSITATNTTAGTDTDSATITVDNASPSNVTGASASPGDGQNTVSWTNPGDSDFSNLIVVRATSTNTGTPTEGSSPAINSAIGNGIVRYNTATTSFIDSGLTNGTAYYYRIFAKDTRGNYSQTGVEVSSTPAAAASADLTQIHYRWRNDDGAEGAGAWYNSSWNYREKITVQSSKVSSTQSNFPVYVNLADLGNDFWTNVKSDCGDIRMTSSDGTTEIARELVACSSTAKTGEVQFKAPSISSSTNTDFYAYFGNSGASDYSSSSTYGANNVWDTNFKGVWHLPNGTTLGALDSTINANNGTITEATAAAGQIDGAGNFDGVNDIVSMGDVLDFNTTDTLSISTWTKLTSTASSSDNEAVGKVGTETNFPGYRIGVNPSNPNAYYFELRASGGVLFIRFSGAASTNWEHITVTYTGSLVASGATLYRNGVSQGQNFVFNDISGSSQTAGAFQIGDTAVGGNFRGSIDETRVSHIVRSSGWILTEYNNQSSPSTFYATSTVEASTTAATWAAAQDTSITGLAKQTTKRLRFEVSNEGTATSSATQYRLEYATSTGASTWTQIGNSAAWVMKDSTYFTDGASTTDVASGLTNENTTFNAGQIKDTGNQTAGITLSTTQFTELEYAIAATSTATDGGTYYFRLTNAGTAIDTYTRYASATLAGAAGSADLTQIHYRWREDTPDLFLVYATTSNPSTGSDRANAIAIDSTYMYVAGYDSSLTNNQWRVEKRNLSNGVLVFAATSNPSTGNDIANAIAIDSTYMYVAGYDSSLGGGNRQWRIEKRNLSDGSLVYATTSDMGVGNDIANAIAIDSTYIYVAGAENNLIGRIEKRNLSDGSLVYAVTSTSNSNDISKGIAIDSTYMYVTGDNSSPGSTQWRIEKRNLSNGALVFATTSNPSTSTDASLAIVIDSTYMYVAGTDFSPGNMQWRIEKRNLSDGSLVYAATSNPSTDNDTARAIAINSTHMYVAGDELFPSDNRFQWRVEKRNLSDGALVSATTSNPSTDNDYAYAIAINSTYMYVAGYDVSPGNDEWLIENRTIGGGEGEAAWAANEDTSITGLAKQTTKRLRFEVSNEGSAVSSAVQYRLEYSTSTTGGWAPVGTTSASTAHWVVKDSTYFTDGASTTDVASGLTNENTTFNAGQIKDTGNQTAGITLSTTQFTELEYAIAATSTATDGGTYYFRLTNAGATSTFTYTIYASATLAGVADLTQLHYRWRNDNGSEEGATFMVAEDMVVSNVAKNSNVRLRFLIHNAGTVTTTAKLRVQYVVKSAACNTIVSTSSWVDIPSVASTEHWQMAASSFFIDLASTTNVASGLTDPSGGTFVSGSIMESSTSSNSIALDINYFTELEFSIKATTNAVSGNTYCFKTIHTDTVLQYPEATIVSGATSGTLTSATFDTGYASGVQLNSIVWHGYQPAQANVRFQLAVSNSSSGPWSFKGPACTTSAGDTYNPTDANVPITPNKTCHNNYRYFRYKIILEANDDLTASPRVDDVIINWSP